MKGIFLGIILFISLIKTSYTQVPFACEASPASAVEVLMKSVSTVYNVFPIRIGGVPILTIAGLEDLDISGNVPFCVCTDPLPRVGIKIGLWEPIAMMEPVKIPWCFPTVGAYIPGIANTLSVGAEGESSIYGKRDALKTLQVHYYRANIFALFDLFMDFICLTSDNPFDVAYFSEVDPSWQNDTIAFILGPEAILVANPIAQLACGADSVASSLGFPLDPLWWCMGSWGPVFPMTQSQQGLTPPIQAAAVTGKMIMKLHRQLILWGSIGSQGLCGLYPMPVWRKSQYGIFPIYPVGYPLRIPIGRTGLLWESGQDPVIKSRHNWVWMIYRKRDCCAF